MTFNLKLSPGSYNVKISALGAESINQLGVGKAEGCTHPYCNGSEWRWVDEYMMENDSVKITSAGNGRQDD